MDASWNQQSGLPVGGGEATMLEAAEQASKWGYQKSLGLGPGHFGCGSEKKPDQVV